MLAVAAQWSAKAEMDEKNVTRRGTAPEQPRSTERGRQDSPRSENGNSERGAENKPADSKSGGDGKGEKSAAEAADSPAAKQRDQGTVMRAEKPEMLGQNEIEQAEMHPAAAAHPGHDVIVCIAGCDEGRGKIVYMRKKSPAVVEAQEKQATARREKATRQLPAETDARPKPTTVAH